MYLWGDPVRGVHERTAEVSDMGKIEGCKGSDESEAERKDCSNHV